MIKRYMTFLRDDNTFCLLRVMLSIIISGREKFVNFGTEQEGRLCAEIFDSCKNIFIW